MEHTANVIDVDEQLDVYTITRWEERVESAGRKSGTVVLDLTLVPFIDSAGVRALFRWAVAAERVGIDLIVVAPPDGSVRRLLEILEIEMVAPLYDSRRKAVQACEEPGKPGSSHISER